MGCSEALWCPVRKGFDVDNVEGGNWLLKRASEIRLDYKSFKQQNQKWMVAPEDESFLNSEMFLILGFAWPGIESGLWGHGPALDAMTPGALGCPPLCPVGLLLPMEWESYVPTRMWLPVLLAPLCRTAKGHDLYQVYKRKDF